MNNAWPLMTAALLMGTGGSLHCMAMCAGLQRMTLRGIPIVTMPAGGRTEGPTAAGTATAKPTEASPAKPGYRLPDGRWWRFQAGRLLGYSLLGAATGFFGQQLLAAASWQPLFESVWAGLNALLIVLGLSLLILGREPVWLAAAGYRLAGRISPSGWRHTEVLRGMLWALLPCGLLYTALATAVLAATPVGAAAVMAMFALGTNAGLLLVESGLHSILSGRRPELAYRLNGLFLMLLSGTALVAALTGMDHPFC